MKFVDNSSFLFTNFMALKAINRQLMALLTRQRIKKFKNSEKV